MNIESLISKINNNPNLTQREKDYIVSVAQLAFTLGKEWMLDYFMQSYRKK